MQFAVTSDGQRVEAARGVQAFCPVCGEALIARCGDVRVHHWAHLVDRDCDAWFEPETEWHRNWKARFPTDRVEVAMGEHRADAVTAKGLVVELQNSPISVQEIAAREQFYGCMIWIVNAEAFVDRLFILKRLGSVHLSMRWKQMKVSWQYAKRPVYLDCGSYQVRHLLGGRTVRYRAGESANGNAELFRDNQLVRLGIGNSAQGDPTLTSLSEEVLGSEMLQIHTLHENGYGSIRPISVEKMRVYLGATLPI